MRVLRPLVLSLLLVLGGGITALSAQNREVSGKVLDANQQPLVGVAVLVDGTTKGVTTSENGTFKIQVPSGEAVLQVTCLGYLPQKVTVPSSRNSITIYLQEDAIMLDATVVIGYGTQKKVNLTGAVATVGSKELENRVTHSLGSMLQGSVAGLNITTSSGKPGSTPAINIRGVNSINSADPLVLIDGAEGDLMKLENEINQKVQENIDKSQRDYYLHEQMKIISEELNDGLSPQAECDEFREKIIALGLDEKSEKKLLKECARLEKMSSTSPEATVIRVYLETCLELPWHKYSTDKLDLAHARKVLDRDHYGLDKVKERIIEALAVRSLSDGCYGQTLCLVGPPGVGKTSIAKSIATAMGRRFARISLGGTSDEAEIRGHRKTYIGAMPGRIINAVKQAGTQNPIILLDEIDKLGSDYKGDPSSALLEALDGEQNSTFVDRYIELEFDLSKVMFITTANDASTIPAPLLDRMEIIELPGYTNEEKFNIAKKHLVPKQAKLHGLNGRTFKINDKALYALIDGYTREAGVRKLEQKIAALCRKAAAEIVGGESKSLTVKESNLEKLLGPKKYLPLSVDKEAEIGVVNGLAWTSVGGEMLQVEAAVFDGTGKVELTGSLGDVMKESAMAAVSFIRSKADKYGVNHNFYKEKDIHIHVPEGAVPKDGPSAGVTMATALLSALTNTPVNQFVAMTGEISLRGRVLPIGGLREKTMAAYRMGIKTVIIPQKNVPDLSEIDGKVRTALKFVPVTELDEVFEIALVTPKEEKERKSIAAVAKKDSGYTAMRI